MTPTPPLTVGLPVFNGEQFVAEALDSILGQTFADFRLVLSDNGSTDATQAICREYAASDSRIRYVRHETNRGAAWNYNHVLEGCDSPFFRWGAADDVFAPTCFERCAEVMARAPENMVMCYTKTRVIDEAGVPAGEYDDDLDLRSSRPHLRIQRIVRRMVRGNPIFGLFRTDVLRATRGHGSFPCADYVLIAEVALAGQIWEIPERLFYRRVHSGMSRLLNPGSEEYTLWLDPSVAPVEHESRRLLHEYLAAVRRAPLSVADRTACYGAVIAAWTLRYGVTKEPLRKLQRAVGGRRAPA